MSRDQEQPQQKPQADEQGAGEFTLDREIVRDLQPPDRHADQVRGGIPKRPGSGGDGV